jgi:L-amino acid N-acyltransferase YncA
MYAARLRRLMTARVATPDDATAMARIYNEGIEDRMATFETRLRSAGDIQSWFDGIHPIVIVEEQGKVIAFAATSWRASIASMVQAGWLS